MICSQVYFDMSTCRSACVIMGSWWYAICSWLYVDRCMFRVGCMWIWGYVVCVRCHCPHGLS